MTLTLTLTLVAGRIPSADVGPLYRCPTCHRIIRLLIIADVPGEPCPVTVPAELLGEVQEGTGDLIGWVRHECNGGRASQ